MFSSLSTLPFLLGILLILWKLFIVPSHLRHIPHVPVLPLLKSYLRGEVEEQRIRKITLPWALEHGHSVVLIWVFGLWFVHILDPTIGKAALDNRVYVRQLPPQDVLFWQFCGKYNVFFTEGEEWKKHSIRIKKALQGSPPISEFVRLSRKTLTKIEDDYKSTEKNQFPKTVDWIPEKDDNAVIVPWDDLLERFALDVIGLTVLGYDFNALEEPNSPFVKGYRTSLKALTAPLYMFIPKLELIFPRKKVKTEMLALRERFADIIDYKRVCRGDDFISRLIEDNVGLKTEELIDSIIVMFIAGHDTTAAALASLTYFLAMYPLCQKHAREEVLSVLGPSDDPTVDSIARLPYLTACIKEALRMNNPSNFSLPRISSTEPTLIGGLGIPPKTPIIFNIAGMHRNDSHWPNVEDYDPQRFMPKQSSSISIDKKEDTSNAWVSFGAGPRQCPAKAFSLYEQQVMGSMLLREYTWSLPENSPHSNGIRNKRTFNALNSPQDLEISFVKRVLT